MAQHDYIISNQTFPNTRADLNNVLQAIATCNKGSSAPSTQYAGQMWIDDSAGTTWTLYLYDGSDNIQVATIDTTANTINFIDSVVTGFDIVTDTTPQLGGTLDTNGNPIQFADNVKAQFGTGNDLEIYHDGSNSYVSDVGTGNLILVGNTQTAIRGTPSGDNIAVFNTGADAKLYYNGASKLATTSTGVDVTGEVVADDVLVGTASAVAGATSLSSNGISGFQNQGNYAISINRQTNDGRLINLQRGGDNKGSIGIKDGYVFIGTGDTGFKFNDTGDDIIPFNLNTESDRDNVIDLGASGTRFKNLYLGGGAVISEATLTDGATISWDVSTSSVAKVTLGGNRTISAPSNALDEGQFISLLVIQDGTGSRTLTWNAVYEFASDTAPTLTTTGGKGDLFVFRYNGTKWLEVGRNLNLTLS